MKVRSRLGCVALLIFIALTANAQQRHVTAEADSAQSYARALKVLEAGIAAVGGLEAIREAQDVSVKVNGFSFARNQSVAVNPPYDRLTREENLYIDLRNRRYIIETRDPAPGGFVFGGKQVINGSQGFVADPRNKTITALNLTNFNNIGLVRRVPHLLLATAYEGALTTLRWVGIRNFMGKSQNAISFASSNGALWTLLFDARTNLLSGYEQVVSDPLAGDTVQVTIFPGYQSIGKLKVPTGRITKRAGEVLEEVNYSDVQFNTHPAESAFAKPSGFDEFPVPTPAAIRETKMAEGVYLFESGGNSLVVEFTDYVIVVEPYGGGRGPQPTINKVRELFPNKLLKYVVVTHHHDDHSGGLRSYIAAGVTVVTTAANQRYFERMAASHFTLNRDEQSKNKRKPVFDVLQNKKRVFSDGKQTLEIIDIGPSPHANEMLIAYLPKEKIAFQGDLINLPNSGKYALTTINATSIHFFETLKRLGLDVERIAAVHGPSTTMEDFASAIRKSQ